MILLLGLSGCGTVEWGVPTTYEIRDLGNSYQARDAIRRELVGRGDRYGFQDVSNGDPYVFRLTKIKDMAQLAEVQRIIQDISEEYNVPVDLTQTTLNFQSVQGTLGSFITVNGTASAGSKVFLDIGETNAYVPEVSPAGAYTIKVRPNKKLIRRGGWVYGLIEKRGSVLYIRTNILDGSTGSEAINAKDLPGDSILRRR